MPLPQMPFPSVGETSRRYAHLVASCAADLSSVPAESFNLDADLPRGTPPVKSSKKSKDPNYEPRLKRLKALTEAVHSAEKYTLSSPSAQPQTPSGYGYTEDGVLVEVLFSTTQNAEGHRILSISVERVVEDPFNDEAILAHTAHLVRQDLARPVLGEESPREYGFAGLVLDSSPSPLMRRLKGAVDARAAYSRQLARVSFQEKLSELGLGRINGVELDALSSLSGDDMATVLAHLRSSYPEATTVGALYYLMEKGTSREDFDSQVEAILTRFNWERWSLDYVLRTLGEMGTQPTAASLAAFTKDPGLVILDALENLVGETARKHILRSKEVRFGGRTWESPEHDLLRRQLEGAPHRPLAEIALDASAPDKERLTALYAAYEAGVPHTDPTAASVLGTMAQAFRIAIITTGGEVQNWAYTLLKLASEQMRSAREH